MKAISLWQPWASAIPAGLKHFETRSWKPPASMMGQRIAIHAALRSTPQLRRWWGEVVTGCASREKAFAAIGVKGFDGLPRGKIVATARLEMVQGTHEFRTPAGPMSLEAEEIMWGDYAPGRFAWRLEQIMWVNPPLPIKGRQGWFEWTPPE